MDPKAIGGLLALALAGARLDADVFDVFEETPLPAGAETAGEPLSELRLEAENALSCRIENAERKSVSAGLPSLEPLLFSGFLDQGFTFKPSPVFELITTIGIRFEKGVEGGEALARAGIREAFLAVRPREDLVMRFGVIEMGSGSDPIFKPTAWFAPPSVDPRDPGAASRFGATLTAYAGDARLSLALLPEIVIPIYDLFSATGRGSGAEARCSLSILGGDIGALVFAETEAGGFAPRRLGLGYELQLPLSRDFGLRSEGLFSDGLEAWTLDRGWPLPLEGSRANWYYEGFLTLDSSLFSLLDLGIGYAYSGRGLAAEAWKSSHDFLAAHASPDPVHDAALLGYQALSQGPEAFMRHRLYLSIGIPRLTSRSGAYLFVFASPEDGSIKALLDASLETAALAVFHLRFEFQPPLPSSVYGSNPCMATISLIADFAASEALR
jgi:hypothetical protein